MSSDLTMLDIGRLVGKLADTMDHDNARQLVLDVTCSILLRYDARHTIDCPQRQQNYWRLRPEYRPTNYGPDKPCTCGLDSILGGPDHRSQS